MGQTIRARLIEYVPSPDGKQADVALIEPNGDELCVRCLVIGMTAEIGGDGEALRYLFEKYGKRDVALAAQGAVLGVGDPTFDFG